MSIALVLIVACVCGSSLASSDGNTVDVAVGMNMTANLTCTEDSTSYKTLSWVVPHCNSINKAVVQIPTADTANSYTVKNVPEATISRRSAAVTSLIINPFTECNNGTYAVIGTYQTNDTRNLCTFAVRLTGASTQLRSCSWLIAIAAVLMAYSVTH